MKNCTWKLNEIFLKIVAVANHDCSKMWNCGTVAEAISLQKCYARIPFLQISEQPVLVKVLGVAIEKDQVTGTVLVHFLH